MFSSVFSTNNLISVNDLINKHGKENIIDFIQRKRNMHITVEYSNGRLGNFSGRVNPDFITPRSIRHDLHLIGVSLGSADKQIGERRRAVAEVEKRRKAEEKAGQKRIAEEKRLAEEKRIAQAKAEEEAKKGLEQDCLNYKKHIDLNRGASALGLEHYLKADDDKKLENMEKIMVPLFQYTFLDLKDLSTKLQTKAIRDIVADHLVDAATLISLTKAFISEAHNYEKNQDSMQVEELFILYLVMMIHLKEKDDLRMENLNEICGIYID